MLRLHMIRIALLSMTLTATAGEPVPEVRRPPATPQAVGVVHTLRTIPEACARLEGRFTGDPAAPYAIKAVRTSERCQPRAALVDAARAKPSVANGWIFNDELRVPAAACATRQAVIRIWRKPAGSAAPKMDAQGRARIYLKDGLDAAEAGKLGAVPLYAAEMKVEGRGCD